MSNYTRFAVLATIGLGAVACANVPTQPPIAGTQTGVIGGQAVRQDLEAIPQESRQATSAGTPTFTGSTGGGEQAGRPTFTRGPGTGTVGGGIPQQFTPPITDRPRGG
jgi:hypothetical protein